MRCGRAGVAPRPHRLAQLIALLLMLGAEDLLVHAARQPQRPLITAGWTGSPQMHLTGSDRRGDGTAPRHAIAASPVAIAEASIQVAARQRLFDYAVDRGLAILNATVKNTTIEEVHATVEVPLLGGIDVTIRDVNVTQLYIVPELTRVAIEAGYYHAAAANVTANITFGRWSLCRVASASTPSR